MEDVEADVTNADDPRYCVEYVKDIYSNLQRTETQHLPDPGYMDKQSHVNAKMRGILVDWLVDVHRKYKLRPCTLFLAISLVDRFLEKRLTARRHLQLVGVAALLIAAKFEEVHPPLVKEFVYVTDKAYTEDEVMRIEASMLTALDFYICRPTAIYFLDRYQVVNGCTDAHHDLAQYLLELAIVDYKMLKYSPSHLAAAAILLSNKLLRRQPSWTPACARQTNMAERSLKECAREMCKLLEDVESSPLQAVRKKFAQQKHHAVSKLNFTGLQSGVALPSRSSMADEAVAAARATSARRTSCPSIPVAATSASAALASSNAATSRRNSVGDSTGRISAV